MFRSKVRLLYNICVIPSAWGFSKGCAKWKNLAQSVGCVLSQRSQPAGLQIEVETWLPHQLCPEVQVQWGPATWLCEAQACIQARRFRHGQDVFVSALHPSGTKRCVRGITVPSSCTTGLRLVRVNKRELQTGPGEERWKKASQRPWSSHPFPYHCRSWPQRVHSHARLTLLRAGYVSTGLQ